MHAYYGDEIHSAAVREQSEIRCTMAEEGGIGGMWYTIGRGAVTIETSIDVIDTHL